MLYPAELRDRFPAMRRPLSLADPLGMSTAFVGVRLGGKPPGGLLSEPLGGVERGVIHNALEEMPLEDAEPGPGLPTGEFPQGLPTEGEVRDPQR